MKKKILAILIMLVVLGIMGCSKNSDKKKDTDKESVSDKTEEIILQPLLDDSEVKTDINGIVDVDITEARILWGDKIYRTTDADVISEIKNKVSDMKLDDADEKYVDESQKKGESLSGDNYNLYLINGDKIIYSFNEYYGMLLSVGSKQYKSTSDFNEVLNYCRSKFWY